MGQNPPIPFARATVKDGGVTLNAWRPFLLDGGPSAVILSSVAGALVDLTRAAGPDGNELFIRPITTPLAPSAAETLLAWAHAVGYRRVWLPDRVIDLDPVTAPAHGAQVVCPTCDVRWEDRTLDFTLATRRSGRYPALCMACGGSLPEWTAFPDEVAERAGCAHEPADLERA